MSRDICKELDELLEECGARVTFGLQAQGHIPTVERMLAEGATWDRIGDAIGWHPVTAREHYELHQLAGKVRAEEGARIRKEITSGLNELDAIPTGTAKIYSRGELQALLDRIIPERSHEP